MPFDPTLPQENTPVDAAQMRAQLNGLNDKIDAVTLTSAEVDSVTTLPAGSPATVSVNLVAGVLHLTFEIPQGPPFASAVVDAVNTLNPGEPATVEVSFDGSVVHFTMGIPRGDTGVQGPPFAAVVVDGVSTLNPEDPATVSASFDGTNVHLSFGIPRGQTGATGEVTNAALAEAIAGTSSNTNAVALPGLAVSDPPTQAEVQSLADKMEEILTALRR